MTAVRNTNTQNLEIIYRDDRLIAINKPHGLLVHRSPIAADTDVYAVQSLRDQIARYVYPCHRLDRKTSGVLLFALDKLQILMLRHQAMLFQQKDALMDYHVVMRSFRINTLLIQ